MRRQLKIWKRLLPVCAAALICGMGTTWAYFTYSRMADNTFHVGNNSIEIVEEYEPPRKLETGENVFLKRVQVKNTGSVPCFVRVFADFSDYAIREHAEISSDGTIYHIAEAYAEHLPYGWVFIGEDESLLGGFYYYTKPLEPGTTTVSLFEKIKCSFDSADQIRPFDILIAAESVQIRDRFGVEFTGETAFRQAWMEYLERR